MIVATSAREAGTKQISLSTSGKRKIKVFEIENDWDSWWMGWTNSNYLDELIRRKKHQHIRRKLRQFLKAKFQIYQNHHKIICEMYKILSSTYQRLKWDLEEIWFEESDGSSFKNEWKKDWEMAKVIIQKSVTPPWHPTTIDKIKQKVWEA